MSVSYFPKTLLALSLSTLLCCGVHAKDTGYLFISSEKDNNVTVLDGKTYAVVKRISTAARPRHMQFNPERSLIYVAAGDGNAIEVIDIAKLELVDRITGIDDPELFDLSPDGKAMYISLEDDGKLGILNLEEYFAKRPAKPELATAVAAPDGTTSEAEDDADEDEDGNDDNDDEATNTIAGLTTLEVGEEPEGVLASPDGKTVYVTSEVANTVHVVDIASNRIKANIVVGNRPRRFALTPDQKELWVSNELSSSVTIIDPTTNQVKETITFAPPGFRSEDVTPVGVTVTQDGKTALVALGRANHVAFVDVASRKVTDYVLVGKRAWNTTLNKDNSLLFVINGLSDDMSIVDTQSRKVLKSLPIARVPHTVLVDD